MSEHILIADHEQSVADNLGFILQNQYEVHVTYSGESALKKIDDKIDVTLLDHQMPDLREDEVLQQICKQKYTCQVAMLTNVDTSHDPIDMPFDAYLSKPVADDELTMTVDRLVQRSKLDAALWEYTELALKHSSLKQKYSEADFTQKHQYNKPVGDIEQLDAKIDRLLATLPVKDVFDVIDHPSTMTESR